MGVQVDIAAGGWQSMAITEEGVVGDGAGMGRLGVSCVWQHVMEQLMGTGVGLGTRGARPTRIRQR